MKLTIVLSDEEERAFSVEVKHSDTIFHLKEVIEAKEKFPVKTQTLYFTPEAEENLKPVEIELADDHNFLVLAKFGIGEGSTLKLRKDFIRVFVRSLDTRKPVGLYRLRKDDMILLLKASIEADKGIQISDQLIYLNDNLLNDMQTIGELDFLGKKTPEFYMKDIRITSSGKIIRQVKP